MITQSRLKELVTYDSLTGIFTWNISRRGQVKFGDVAGSLHRLGYIVIKLDGIPYKAHRLAWLFEYGRFPIDQIDHKNEIKSDNRIDNLRECSNAENHRNISITKANTSGFKGVYFDKRRRHWVVQIKVLYKNKYIGSFSTKEEAAIAYNNAAVENHGEFANIN